MTPEDRARAIADQLTCFVPDEDVAMIAGALREAVAAEREACAKVAEHPAYNIPRIAAAIRARGEA